MLAYVDGRPIPSFSSVLTNEASLYLAGAEFDAQTPQLFSCGISYS